MILRVAMVCDWDGWMDLAVVIAVGDKIPMGYLSRAGSWIRAESWFAAGFESRLGVW